MILTVFHPFYAKRSNRPCRSSICFKDRRGRFAPVDPKDRPWSNPSFDHKTPSIRSKNCWSNSQPGLHVLRSFASICIVSLSSRLVFLAFANLPLELSKKRYKISSHCPFNLPTTLTGRWAVVTASRKTSSWCKPRESSMITARNPPGWSGLYMHSLLFPVPWKTNQQGTPCTQTLRFYMSPKITRFG